MKQRAKVRKPPKKVYWEITFSDGKVELVGELPFAHDRATEREMELIKLQQEPTA